MKQRKNLFIPLLLLFLIFFLSCKADQSLKQEGIELSKPSKIKDLLSMLSLAFHGGGGDKFTGPLTQNQVRIVLTNFFDALRWQKRLTVSTFLSEKFYFPGKNTKEGYLASLENLEQRMRILKQEIDIKDLLLSENEALAKISMNGINVYLKSGLIDEYNDTNVFVWLKIENGTLKIIEMIYESDLPLSSVKNGFYEDLWLFYKFKQPQNYLMMYGTFPNAVEYLYMRHRERPIVLYMSVSLLDKNIGSTKAMVDNDLKYIKSLDTVQSVEEKQFKHKNYDGSSLEFNYTDASRLRTEKRVYLWRSPLMYVAGIYADKGDDFKEGLKDFHELINSFSYIETKGELKKNLLDEFKVSGNKIQNNFYKFSIDAPIDWKIDVYKNDVVQFKPVTEDIDGIAYLSYKKSDKSKTVKDRLVRTKKLTHATFKFYKISQEKEISVGALKGYKLSSKFKSKLFAKYHRKNQFFIEKGDYIYELGLESTNLSKAKIEEYFQKFIDGLELK